jgi:pSer/pThr/pTyr-binding forkhead associated (FHA) protein
VQDRQFPVDTDIFHIGAAPDNNLIIKHDDYVSGHHACLHYKQGTLSIVDQRSKNGTFVNDNRLRDAPLIVKAGDRIRMGKSIVEVVWVKSEDEKRREDRLL